MYLSQWRRKKKMTAAQLAEKLNVCSRTVARMENGEMTSSTAGRLLAVFGTELLGVDEVAAFYPYLKFQSAQKQTEAVLNHIIQQVNKMNECSNKIKVTLPILNKLLKNQGSIEQTATLEAIETAPVVEDDLSFLEVD